MIWTSLNLKILLTKKSPLVEVVFKVLTAAVSSGFRVLKAAFSIPHNREMISRCFLLLILILLPLSKTQAVAYNINRLSKQVALKFKAHKFKRTDHQFISKNTSKKFQCLNFIKKSRLSAFMSFNIKAIAWSNWMIPLLFR